MENWVGPAVTATIISSLIAITGWYVALRTSLRLDRTRREEKVRDVQTAVLAEIESNQSRFAIIDLDAHLGAIASRIRTEPNYTPYVPKDASTIIFDALLKAIHILPISTVEPVVSYYKQVIAVGYFVEDLRSESFRSLDPDRQIAMYTDYIDMIRSALNEAERAHHALSSSLKRADRLSSPASDHRSPPASASASNQTSATPPSRRI